jgi:uncharacterized integral membrane protein (TIGR00698 family)
LTRWPALARGLAVAAALALAATLIAARYGGPQFLYALFFGIAFNFLSSDPRAEAGIHFAARTVLRVGVALLGARISLAQIAALGGLRVLLVVGAVFATIAFGAWLSRALRRPYAEGLLTGGAVAICGASAALAIAAVLPRNERSTQFTLLTVVGVTALSTLAMITYPAAVPAFHLDSASAGLLLGGTIHDVAQVVAAGHMISEDVGAQATFVKLLRVALLAPVVVVLSLIFREPGRRLGVRAFVPPWFLIVFMALVAANAAGFIPASVERSAGEVSRGCLVVAIAALGVMTSFRELAALGWRPVVMLVSETAFIAILMGSGLVVFRGGA